MPIDLTKVSQARLAAIKAQLQWSQSNNMQVPGANDAPVGVNADTRTMQKLGMTAAGAIGAITQEMTKRGNG